MPRAIDRDKYAKVVELTGKGLSIATIAAELGCSARTVVRARRRVDTGPAPVKKKAPAPVKKKKAPAPPPPLAPPPASELPPLEVVSGSGSDDDIAIELRRLLVMRMRRLEGTAQLAERRLNQALSEPRAASSKPKDYAITLGVVVDKQVALVRAAKEISPRIGAEEDVFDDRWYPAAEA